MFGKKKKNAENDQMSSGARREAEELLAQAQADRELSMDALGGVAGGGIRDRMLEQMEFVRYHGFECPNGDYTGPKDICPNCGTPCRPKIRST